VLPRPQRARPGSRAIAPRISNSQPQLLSTWTSCVNCPAC
jgi:hypothetical protein